MKSTFCLVAFALIPVAAQNVKQGRSLYESSTGHVCHGALGDGRGAATKNAERPLKPAPAAFSARLKYGDDLASIMRSIRKGIPGTVMIGYEGIMTEEQIADLAAYIQTFQRQKTGIR
jgi:mono/diheme cytochrome c family protein